MWLEGEIPDGSGAYGAKHSVAKVVPTMFSCFEGIDLTDITDIFL